MIYRYENNGVEISVKAATEGKCVLSQMDVETALTLLGVATGHMVSINDSYVCRTNKQNDQTVSTDGQTRKEHYETL